MHLAVSKWTLPILHIWIELSPSMTSLYYAAEFGQLHIVKYFTDEKGYNLLCLEELSKNFISSTLWSCLPGSGKALHVTQLAIYNLKVAFMNHVVHCMRIYLQIWVYNNHYWVFCSGRGLKDWVLNWHFSCMCPDNAPSLYPAPAVSCNLPCISFPHGSSSYMLHCMSLDVDTSFGLCITTAMLDGELVSAPVTVMNTNCNEYMDYS